MISPHTVLLLVGMSASDVARREDLLAAAAGQGAGVAFLQMGDPSLPRELTRLADLGTASIVLAGVSFGPLAPAHSWLRRVAAHWWRERTAHRPIVEVATRLATSLEDLEDVLRDRKPISGSEAGLVSAAWESVTRHRHQVLVCRGPRCTARGSEATAGALVLGLMQAGLGDHDVLLTHTGCLLPCNHAPVVTVQPDDVWYGGVDPETARRVVTDHLVAGTPVTDRRLER